MLLLLISAIWGFAFVAQRMGMDSLDAMSFNAIRFALGALFVRLILGKGFQAAKPFPWLIGLVLFLAASLQQIGMIYTTAGNAGFITGLYVLFVPLLGYLRGQKTGRSLWLAIAFAIIGIYLMNSGTDIKVNLGNFLVLISSLFWALHVQLVDKYSKSYATSSLAVAQFSACALYSAVAALLYLMLKSPSLILSQAYWEGVQKAALPLLYAGFLSVGVAYTLQVQAQKMAHPVKAAVILSLEGVFALLGGYLLLREELNSNMILGALMLLAAMLILSIPKKYIDRNRPLNSIARM